MTSENQNQIFLPQSYKQEPKKQKKLIAQTPDAYLKKWSVSQNILYGRYLKTHMGQMSNKRKKKCGKFVKMSNFIGSKSQNQCRSHHQKMLLTFKSLQNIIRYVGEVKRRGELVTVQEYQQRFGLDLGKQGETKELSKMEEQISTERQSQQSEIKNEPNNVSEAIQKGDQSLNLPINQVESKPLQHQDEGIFDVLEINKYAEFFLY